MLLLALACTSPDEEAPPVEEASYEETVSAGKEALAEAGVSRLRWGMTAFVDPESAVERWQPLWDHVGDELGVTIELVPLEAYEGVEEAMRRGEVDGATFRPRAYVHAREAMPLQLVGTHVVGGSAEYSAYIIMLEDQSVRDVAGLPDLGGGPFGFVHPNSTSGFIYPAAMLQEAGVHPLEDVEARWYRSHAGVFDAVSRGAVLAGAVNSIELALSASDPSAPSMRIVAKSDRIPYSAYVLREGLPPAAVSAMAAAMNGVSTKSAEGRELLRALPGVNGFLPVEDGYYDPVRDAAEVLEAKGIDPDALELPSGG